MHNLVEKIASSPGVRAARVTASDLPELSTAKSETRFGDVFYALLQTNERVNSYEQETPPESLTGAYVGIGFGASLYLLRRHFTESSSPILICEREPYVYLMGKIFLSLLERCESPLELFLAFLDADTFVLQFREAIAAEADGSPVFLRRSRHELLENVPEEFEKLRFGLFSTRHHKLTTVERRLFKSNSPFSILDKSRWVQHFLRYKCDSVKREVVDHFTALKTLLVAERTLALCIDFFHPAFWQSLAGIEQLWREPSMVYFSNAAVYSSGEGIRKDLFSTSNPYTTSLISDIPGAHEGRHRFIYTVKCEQYELVSTSNPPAVEELLESFRPKSAKVNSLIGRVEHETVNASPPQQPATAKGVFRIGKRPVKTSGARR